MDCSEESLGDPVFIGDDMDVCVDGCINGGRDVPARVRECELMVTCFWCSRS